MQSNTCRLFFYPSQGSNETREGHCDSEFPGAGATARLAEAAPASRSPRDRPGTRPALSRPGEVGTRGDLRSVSVRGRWITKGRNDENTKRKTPLGITIRFATSLPELECMKTGAAQVSTEPKP
jgi:hypothetical protein